MITLRSLSAAVVHSFARRRANQIKQRIADETESRAKAEAAAEALRLEDERRAAVERQRRIERWLARRRVSVARPQDIEMATVFRRKQIAAVTKASIKAAEIAKADAAEIAALHEAERLRHEQHAAHMRAELERRQAAALDLDGSLSAQRRAREEQLEQDRLDFLAAQIVRRSA